jgi:predicted Ser/Thr protein kinase
MGVVYLGRDPVIGRLVALKTIRAVGEDDVEQREFQERFLREAQAAGILSHPNIVTVHDVGEDQASETSFIAMEYVEGRNLKQLLADKTPFTFERIAEVIGQVAEALDYAHRRGIVHRDVKPANIIITPENQVKITDFGIAKTEKSNLTSTGQFLGTPNYMSPEQVTGDAVDGRSDLFSLGVVLYELLTRKKPFTADNLTSISYKIVHEQFVPPETYDASIPQEFANVLGRALSKDPGERYQRGNDFALALYEYKAREEERQMLRDLGQMVAEAEKLGPVATVTAPPSTLPPAPAPAPAPAMGRSPFEILAGAPPAPAPPPLPAAEEDDLATREVQRPLPATTYVAPTAAMPNGEAPRSSADWQLDEPTKSKKGVPPPPPPEPPAVDVDASLPGPEVEPAPRVGGLAVSPFDSVPASRDLEPVPEGATEIIRISALPGLPTEPPVDTDRVARPVASPAPPAGPEPFVDRPTEILRPVAPPAPPAPEPPAPPAPFTDRPTEILQAIPAPVPAIPAPPAVAPASPEPFVDRPTEILRPLSPPAPVAPPPPAPPAPAPFTDRPTEILQAIPAPAPPAPVESPAEKPTEILRSPFTSPPAPKPPTPPPGDDEIEGATERIVDAMKLASAGAPAAKRPTPPPPATPPPPKVPPPPAARPSAPGAPAARPASSAAVRPVPPKPSAAAPVDLPPVDLAPLPEPAKPAPEGPPPPFLKRGVNTKFVAIILAVVVVLAGAVVGALWARKSKIDAQAAVDEVREREVRELKVLMEDGNRLLAAGNPEQAVAKFQEVVRRSADSVAAREALARAEESLKAKRAGEEVGREVQDRLAKARSAAETGDFDTALNELSAVLLLQPENSEALSIRESVKAAQAEKIAAEKKAAAELAKKKKPTPVPTPTKVVKPVVVVETPKPATPTPASARLRIVFQSPAPEGLIMVRRNDKEIFRRQFDFGRKSAGGLVEGTVEVPSGPANFKVWVIPTDRSFNGYRPVDLVVPGGETHSLVLELNAAKEIVVSIR